MKILIVYYSWKGHTETVARALGQKTGGTVVRIEPVIDPGTHIGRMGMKAAFGMKEAIKPVQTDISEIDHLVIATPVWSHNMPPFMRQYLSALSGCSGKKFSVLVEMGGSGGEKVVKKVRKVLEGNGMTFAASAITIEKDVDAGNFSIALDDLAQKINEG